MEQSLVSSLAAKRPASHSKQRTAPSSLTARPFLQADDGDVEFVSFESDVGVLVLRLLGNCAVCPMSRMTLRAGIEKLIKLKIPEVNRVESENRW